MSDAQDQAQERVDKAARINVEVRARLDHAGRDVTAGIKAKPSKAAKGKADG
jgi:hypothetical protein